MRCAVSRFRRKPALQLSLTPKTWTLSRQPIGVPGAPTLGQGVLAPHWHADEMSRNVVLAQLATAIQQHNGDIQIVLDDTLVRSFLVTPPTNVHRLHDLALCAQMRFESLYDESSASWEIHADWRADQAFVTCAIRRELVTSLRELSQGPTGRVISIQPAWLSSWNAHAENTTAGWWAIGNAQSLVLLLRGAQGPLDLRSLSFVSIPPRTTLDAVIAQEASRLQVLHNMHDPQLLPSALRWLGTAPWLPHVQVVSP